MQSSLGKLWLAPKFITAGRSASSRLPQGKPWPTVYVHGLLIAAEGLPVAFVSASCRVTRNHLQQFRFDKISAFDTAQETNTEFRRRKRMRARQQLARRARLVIELPV